MKTFATSPTSKMVGGASHFFKSIFMDCCLSCVGSVQQSDVIVNTKIEYVLSCIVSQEVDLGLLLIYLCVYLLQLSFAKKCYTIQIHHTQKRKNRIEVCMFGC